MATRRIVVRKRAAVSAVSDFAKERLQSISNKLREIAKLRSEIDACEADIALELKDFPLGTTVVAEDGTTASMVAPPGRSSTVVDARGLRKLLTDDKEFYACISVSVTQARQYVPAKTLARISDVLPATPGRPELKVKLPK